MGSRNSGRWLNHCKADVVEDSQVLDLVRLLRDPPPGHGASGRIEWYRFNIATSLAYEVWYGTDGPYLILQYARAFGEIELPIRLVTTSTRWGEIRWWGICPLCEPKGPCNRRVGKLCLPWYAQYFGCRQCHALSYESAQMRNTRAERDQPKFVRVLFRYGVNPRRRTWHNHSPSRCD